jgi:hypothetical protein
MEHKTTGISMTPDRQKEIERRAKQDYDAMRSGWPVRNPFLKDEEYLLWFNYLQLLKKNATI